MFSVNSVTAACFQRTHWRAVLHSFLCGEEKDKVLVIRFCNPSSRSTQLMTVIKERNTIEGCDVGLV